MCAFVCVCVCVYVFVYNGFLFVFYYICAVIRFTTNQPPSYLLHRHFPPLLYTDSSVDHAILWLLHVAPPPSPIVQAARQLTCYLASESLVSSYLASGSLDSSCLDAGVLSLSTVLAVPSLPHLPDPISGGCIPPCPWRHRGEMCWTLLLLVTTTPLRSHAFLNIPASDYY